MPWAGVARNPARVHVGLMVVVVLVAFAAVPAFASASPTQEKWIIGGTAKKAVDPVSHGQNHVISMDTTLPDSYGFASVALGVKADALTGRMNLKYYLADRSCGGGSPRFSLAVDKNGDGVRDANMFGYVGPTPGFASCAPNVWTDQDLTDGVARWDVTQLGGPFYNTWADAVAFLARFPDYKILRGALVDDSAWFSGAAGRAFYDDIRMGDQFWSDPSDTVVTSADTGGAANEAGASGTHGFDEFGYNDNARIFVGTGMSWCMAKVGDAAWCNSYLGVSANDGLVMKWNAEWDRGNAEGWANPPYAAWTSNHWNGNTEGGSGVVWQYKIQWVGTCGEGALLPDGGYCIWGQFEVLMDQGHDASGHTWFAHATPAGYGA